MSKRRAFTQHDGDFLAGDGLRLVGAQRDQLQHQRARSFQDPFCRPRAERRDPYNGDRALAMASGRLSAMRFGTSSPKMRVRYEITSTTTTKLIAVALRAGQPPS